MSSSPDYPQLAQHMMQASGEMTECKLPAGLYVVATPIGHRGDITLRALMTLAQVSCVVAEDTRTTGALLNGYGLHKPLLSYTEHKDEQRTPKILDMIKDGQAVALVSDAGLPLIADPGQRLVQAVVEAGLSVTVIPGANAALTALAGAGLSTERFCFMGFLPNQGTARQKILKEISGLKATLVFYESPHRCADCLDDMAIVLGGHRSAAVARELTKIYEETRRGTLGDLAAFYAENPIKGEVVIVVAADDTVAPAPALTDREINHLLRNLLTVHSLRDAVAEAVEVTGLKKSIVYARALALLPEEE